MRTVMILAGRQRQFIFRLCALCWAHEPTVPSLLQMTSFPFDLNRKSENLTVAFICPALWWVDGWLVKSLP